VARCHAIATARVVRRPIASCSVLSESAAAVPPIATNSVVFALFFENWCGAPSKNRTCDLGFRKAMSCVGRLESTGGREPASTPIEARTKKNSSKIFCGKNRTRKDNISRAERPGPAFTSALIHLRGVCPPEEHRLCRLPGCPSSLLSARVFFRDSGPVSHGANGNHPSFP
jgi:hypothetical protein